MNALRRGGIAALLLSVATLAQAGRSCEPKVPDALAVQRAMTLAERTARRLDESGAQVVLLARIGQDLSRHGQRYSHMGLAYREGAAWRVVHKLNHCGSARAAVYRQGLGEFFLDDLHEYEAGAVIPTPAVQAALLPVLRDDQRVVQLHTPAYSMVAYPWSQAYQQSNQWALETLAMTQDPAVTSRERAQAWLRLQGYEPTALRLGAMTRLGARVTAANVAFDDHPNSKRFADRIETVTVDSVFTWLQRSQRASAPLVIR